MSIVALRAWAWAAALFALTVWLGRLDLLDPDEARHAEVAREMLASGRWLTPVLHGEPYYDKPAAFYWLLAVSMRLFGENAWAARVPGATAALLTVLATARFARRAYSAEAAALAVAGLATTSAFVVLGRTVIIDMPFTAAMTAALAWLGAWWLDTPARRRSILPFYVALGAASLLKGPVALALGALAAAGIVAVSREAATIRALRPLSGALVVLAIAGPWYVAAWHADPDYLREFLLRHNVERYLRPIGAGHVEPWWYYLVALPAMLLPWTPLVAAAAADRLRTGTRTAADVYCALWAAVVLAFFAPASTKLATYLLPALPPLACLTAAWVADRTAALPRFVAPYALSWTAVVAAAASGAAAYAILSAGGAGDSSHAAAVAIVTAALGAAAMAWRAHRLCKPRVSLAAAAAASLALTTLAYTLVADRINDVRDARSAAAVVRRVTRSSGELVAYRCVPHAVAFYARRAAVRTRERERALAALSEASGGALLTEKKRLAELGLEPPPRGVRRAWASRGPLVLLVRRRGGEGRESNPPPTKKAGVTVLKTGRATGPDPSPRSRRARGAKASPPSLD